MGRPEHRRKQVCEGRSPFAGSRTAAQLASLSGLALAVEGAQRLTGDGGAKALAATLAGRHLQRSGVPVTPAAIKAYVADVQRETPTKQHSARSVT